MTEGGPLNASAVEPVDRPAAAGSDGIRRLRRWTVMQFVFQRKTITK